MARETSDSLGTAEPPDQGGGRSAPSSTGFGIRGKLALSLALAAILPLGASAALTTRLMEERFRRDLDLRAERLGRSVKQAYLRTGRQVRGSLVSLSEQAFVDELLIESARGGLRPETERRTMERAPGLMQAVGLDALTLLDQEGRVIAAGHLPGLAGTRRTQRGSADRPALLRVRIRRGAQTPERLCLQVTETVERYGATLHLLGGRVLEGAFLRGLLPGDDAQLRLLDSRGRAVGAYPPQGLPSSCAPRRIPLPAEAGGEAAFLELSLSDLPLQRRVRAVAYTAAGAAGVGVLLALLVAAILSSRITHPLRTLVRGVARVAAGELDAQVEVRGRDEIAELARSFNRMTSELEKSRTRALRAERIAAWREMARRLAHEIKNPLSPIRTSVETLQKLHGRDHPRFREAFEQGSRTILQEVERLRRIVSEFSQFARLPAPRREPRDLAEVVEAALGLYLGLVEGISLEKDLCQGLAVLVDGDQVVQVVLNLVQNAVQVLEGEGSVRVVVSPCQKEPGFACLSVSDSGPGVPVELADRIFEPYVTNRAGGTGLGLAVVERIVSEHGGRIELLPPRAAASEPEAAGSSEQKLGGACFRIWLPLAR